VIAVNDGGITVKRSDGNSFGSNESWAGAYFGDKGEQSVYFADVTGDGRADAVVVTTGGTFVRRSTGLLFTSNEFWSSPFYNLDTGAGRGTFLTDVNGDGRADAVVVNNSSIFVKLSTGINFGSVATPWAGAFFGTRGTFFADVTGDRGADAIVVNDGGLTVRRAN